MTRPTRSPALLTDRYEYTMLDAALADGTASRRSAFEVFARSLPPGRRIGVFAGIGRIIDDIVTMAPSDDDLAWLDDEQIVSPATLAWLSAWRFSGTVLGYREGEPYVAGSPVLTVVAPFAEAVLLETLVLSALNHDSAVAAAAARMRVAADARILLEFGARRAHEDAAVAAARAAWIAGFDATSNLAAGRRYGIPTAGTVAHAFVLLHDDEPAAFSSQLDAATTPTTMLVDTFDTVRGVEHAIEAALARPGRISAIRIDSGELSAAAHDARRRLDAAGLTRVKIIVSGDLDEHRIAELGQAPVDGFGVGTSVVTGSGAPTAGFVYKLVARAQRPSGPLVAVSKGGGVKATVGGVKRALRRVDGVARDETVTVVDDVDEWMASVTDGGEHGDPADVEGSRELQVPFIVDGQVVDSEVTDEDGLETSRRHHRRALAELDAEGLRLDEGPAGLRLLTDDRRDTGPLRAP